jgi:protein-tyrosine phosphatase
MFDFLFFNKSKKSVFSGFFDSIEVDIHSHLIPMVDDGSPDLTSSIHLIKQMHDLGLKKIITTPHISELYPNSNDAILDGLIRLRKELKKQAINVELSVAAEYMVNDIFERMILSEEPLLTLPERHVLIEMPHISEPVNLYKVLSLLKKKGYTPILAHPERYRFYNRNLFDYEKLKSYGCLFQMNILSLVGYYGHSISACSWTLLNNKMIDFIGSDIHHDKHIDAIKDGITFECQQLLHTYPFKNKAFFGCLKPEKKI